jgi:hypothetical protein
MHLGQAKMPDPDNSTDLGISNGQVPIPNPPMLLSGHQWTLVPKEKGFKSSFSYRHFFFVDLTGARPDLQDEITL